MFWNKKPAPDPLGVRLGDLMPMLAPTSIEATPKNNVLLARHEHYTVRIEVVSPDDRDSENGPIQAVVRMVTDLPAPIQSLFQGRDASATATFNSFAALGALYRDGGKVKIGSRLTIYEADDAWRSLHLPLVLYTTISGAEAILGALRRTMTNESPRGGDSEWTSRDFAQAERHLSRVFVCTTDGVGLTAEFGLKEDALTPARGDQNTAMFQMIADQPHPELGGGLFCMLQMPHRISDEERLQKACLQMNQMEMTARDLPPHFGAWCPGRLGYNPAYVSFLPNALHSVSGIAVNMAYWAINRAQWANATLASLNVRS